MDGVGQKGGLAAQVSGDRKVQVRWPGVARKRRCRGSSDQNGGGGLKASTRTCSTRAPWVQKETSVATNTAATHPRRGSVWGARSRWPLSREVFRSFRVARR